MTVTLPSVRSVVPNPAWAALPLFDRMGWKRMAFGEFAENVGERAERGDAQDEIYVGLEHLDPQCLHTRRRGKGSDVTGTKLRFLNGDILFGVRRAYQRKMARRGVRRHLPGSCNGVRAKPAKVLPEFLPFLMMSDRFMNRAIVNGGDDKGANSNVERDQKVLHAAQCTTKTFGFPGGHIVAPAPVVAEAMEWLKASTVPGPRLSAGKRSSCSSAPSVVPHSAFFIFHSAFAPP